VFGLLTVEDAVSPGVTAGEIWFSLISFTSIYLILLAVLIWLFVRTARRGPTPEDRHDAMAGGYDPYSVNPAQGGGPIVTP
jgi:cytochrome d ubiquinol oxidase subunit I